MIIYLLNILLVEDDKDTLRLIQKYFEKKGAHVSAFSNPLLALQHFMKNGNDNNKDNCHYDLIISEIKFPEMNGIELISIIRKMNKDTPIIFMSSDIKDIDHSILRSLNIEDIITKPIKLKNLLEKINTIKQKVIVKQLS